MQPAESHIPFKEQRKSVDLDLLLTCSSESDRVPQTAMQHGTTFIFKTLLVWFVNMWNVKTKKLLLNMSESNRRNIMLWV